MYWMIEVAPSTKTLEVQFVKQLYIFCVTEIGTANPYLIVLIEQLLGLDSGQPFELDSMARIADLLNSVKRSPVPQLVNNAPILRAEFACLRYLIFQIETRLDMKMLDDAINISLQYYAVCKSEPGWIIDKVDWRGLKQHFDAPAICQHVGEPEGLMWLLIVSRALKCMRQESCNLICYLHHICCGRGNKWRFLPNGDSRPFWRHAFWTLLNEDEIKPDELQLSRPLKEIEELSSLAIELRDVKFIVL